MAREEEESSNDLRVDVALTCAVSLGRRFPKHMKIDLLPETCEMCSSQQAGVLLFQATQLELPSVRVRCSIHMHGAHSAGHLPLWNMGSEMSLAVFRRQDV